jgi:hypothetical protein
MDKRDDALVKAMRYALKVVSREVDLSEDSRHMEPGELSTEDEGLKWEFRDTLHDHLEKLEKKQASHG